MLFQAQAELIALISLEHVLNKPAVNLNVDLQQYMQPQCTVQIKQVEAAKATTGYCCQLQSCPHVNSSFHKCIGMIVAECKLLHLFSYIPYVCTFTLLR